MAFKMNKEELDEKVEFSFKFAEKCMNESGGFYLMFEIIFKDSEGKTGNCVMVLGDDAVLKNRAKYVSSMGGIFSVMQVAKKIEYVKCVLMTTEAWISHKSVDEYKANPNAMPSDDPKRKEVLLVCGLTTEGLTTMKAKEIGRIHDKFILTDMPEMKENEQGGDNYLLGRFYYGFKRGLEFKDLYPESHERRMKEIENMNVVEILEYTMNHLNEALKSESFRFK